MDYIRGVASSLAETADRLDKVHLSDADESSPLPIFDADPDAVAVRLDGEHGWTQDQVHRELGDDGSSALTEAQFLSSIDENLVDGDFAADLLTDPSFVDEFANDPGYPVTGPPPLVTETIEMEMTVSLPPGRLEPGSTFRMPLPRFEGFESRNIVLLGCRLREDVPAFFSGGPPVPIGISISNDTRQTALVRKAPAVSPEQLAEDTRGLLFMMPASASAGELPSETECEVVNGELLACPSWMLGAALGTGPQEMLYGRYPHVDLIAPDTRHVAVIPNGLPENGKAEDTGGPSLMPQGPCYLPRTLRTFAALLDFCHAPGLCRKKLRAIRETLHAHHCTEYMLSQEMATDLLMYCRPRWRRGRSDDFHFRVERLDGKQWQPSETEWSVRVEVVFEVAAAGV